jgi:hypothetical protein
MDMITCPKCGFKFPLDEGLDFEMKEKYRIETERELRQNVEREVAERLKKDLVQKDNELERVKRELQEKERQLFIEQKNKELEISNVMKEKEFEIKKKFFDELQVTREEYQRELNKKIEEIEEKHIKEMQDREVKNREERERLQREIENIKGTLSSTSAELTGEVQELELETILKSNFKNDLIEPVPRGTRGADLIQTVYMPGGLECGKIVWESKKTKQWSDSWIDKLKEDRRDSGSDVAILVTTAMPRGEKGITLRGGVIVTEFQYVRMIAAITRENLIRLKKANVSQTDRLEKEALVYEYITGREFRERIQAIVDSWTRGIKDLEDEKRTLTRIWARRYKELEIEIMRLAEIYGNIQGIAGNSLEDIKGLRPSITSGDENIEDGREDKN